MRDENKVIKRDNFKIVSSRITMGTFIKPHKILLCRPEELIKPLKRPLTILKRPLKTLVCMG